MIKNYSFEYDCPRFRRLSESESQGTKSIKSVEFWFNHEHRLHEDRIIVKPKLKRNRSVITRREKVQSKKNKSQMAKLVKNPPLHNKFD